jgi:hypothetical protein
MGAYDMRQTDKQEAAAREESKASEAQFLGMLGGGGGGTTAAPAMAPQGGVATPPGNIPPAVLGGGAIRTDGIQPTMVSALTDFQKEFPEVRLTSGYRDPSHNARVGGASGSRHIHGDAADFSLAGLPEDRQKAVVEWWNKRGAGGFGFYPQKNSMHVDFGQRRFWGPNFSSSSIGQTPQWFQDFAAGKPLTVAQQAQAQAAGVDTSALPPQPQMTPTPPAMADRSLGAMMRNAREMEGQGQPTQVARIDGVPLPPQRPAMLSQPPAQPLANVAPMQGGIAPAQVAQVGGATAAPQPAPATPAQQVAQANPQLLQAAMARMNDPYASPGSRAVAQALVQRLVTQETKDPLDIERKQLELQKLRNDLSNSGMTKRQQELAIQKAEKDLETKPNIEIIRDAATGEVIAIDKNNIKAGIQKLREGGPSSTAPTTKTIKQPDGSEVAVQWNPTARAWEPLKAPEGGNAVKAPGKLTEQQSKDLVYYNRGSQALAQLDKVGSDALASTADVAKSKIPGVGNMLVSEKFQQARQAGTNFLASILRKDSGAAITVPEEEIYGRIFLPQPGDGLAVLSQKTEARRQAMDAIRTGLGPAEVLALGERLIKPENAKTPKPDGASAAPGTGPRIISVEPIR